MCKNVSEGNISKFSIITSVFFVILFAAAGAEDVSLTTSLFIPREFDAASDNGAGAAVDYN